ncbi:unnamed protein product [Colias eurytheme]|nr:unnamed protein product [Colias eurytheme]
MSGLSYLCEYGGSDESESEEVTKKPKLPPPDLSKISTIPIDSHLDDPDQHNGRLRSFPHIRGNWATYAYIQYPQYDNLNEIIVQFKEVLRTINEPSYLCDNLHISVTKTIVLKYHLISVFTTSLQDSIKSLESFELGFQSVAVYTNEEKTRTFLALKTDHFSKKYLLKITESIDAVLSEFSLPKFYEDPSFHMSILWWNGDWKNIISEKIEELNGILMKDSEVALNTVTIKKVDCKVGNRFYQFCLDCNGG